MKKILILGSNSFSGNHLINYLLKKNFYIIGCSLSRQSEAKFNSINSITKKKNQKFQIWKNRYKQKYKET